MGSGNLCFLTCSQALRRLPGGGQHLESQTDAMMSDALPLGQRELRLVCFIRKNKVLSKILSKWKG